jgi:hypothetical protein
VALSAFLKWVLSRWHLIHAAFPVIACAGSLVCCGPCSAADPSIDFNRAVRPLLSEYCFACHGPDEEQRRKVKSKLRLDTQEGLFTKLGDIVPVIGGDAGHSEVLRRVTTTDEDDRMPPATTGKHLNADQIALIKRWIDQGAHWEQHWAFVAPKRPNPPTVTDAAWPRNDIDRFVLPRLERDGLHHAAEAPMATLIRRLSLDITGLPPSPAEVDAVSADTSPQAYEHCVDRLLASPHYGERMAMAWMDGARYADSNGYQADHERSMWRWRDWLIDAFNQNLPFDQFTIEQLAGDLLPNATPEQRIATGFCRNHRINTEGGIIADEWHVETVIDRVDTTGQVWLGLTLGCARCHDHKYDPISQKDFYRLFAFYNNVPEPGVGKEELAGTPPFMAAPTPAQSTHLAELDAAVARARSQRDEYQKQSTSRDSSKPISAWTPLLPQTATSDKGTVLSIKADGALLASTPAETDVYTIRAPISIVHIAGVRLETLPHDTMPGKGSGFGKNGNFALSEMTITLVTPTGRTVLAPSSVNADFAEEKWPASNAVDGKDGTAWSVLPQAGKRHELVLQVTPVAVPPGTLVEVRLSFASPRAKHLLGHWRLAIAESAQMVDNERDLAQAESARASFEQSLPTVMVMEEMAKPRPTYVLQRGLYDHHGDEVSAGTPSAFPPLPAGAPANRLGLARWIADPANPLTARVAVNRMWERLFGIGLVKSSDNLGSQGELPSHPELLDWLATEFIRLHWDMKLMLKTMVMSATYRQDSATSAALAASDPDNRLLAHGPRFRLQAETIRDQALAVAGLLTEAIGGPSVRPYQPPGIWDELSNYGNLHNYKHDAGANLYRRSIYTIWKRTTPPPDMVLFDMPSREYCLVRRSRTDTPLQALTLLNDVTFVEAARLLAGAMMRDGGSSVDSRLTYGFRRALVRLPSAEELGILREGFTRRLARFRAEPTSATHLIAQGDTPADAAQDPSELAAYTTVASTIINLDEAITKP